MTEPAAKGRVRRWQSKCIFWELTASDSAWLRVMREGAGAELGTVHGGRPMCLAKVGTGWLWRGFMIQRDPQAVVGGSIRGRGEGRGAMAGWQQGMKAYGLRGTSKAGWIGFGNEGIRFSGWEKRNVKAGPWFLSFFFFLILFYF